jgi:glycosyltransferase involved in cell wall biosynthesis
MTTEHKPLISAIVSTYNAERFIKGKIEDLLAQTIADKLEIIIVNSGSQQNEEKIIKDFFSDLIDSPAYPSIHYIRTEERESIYKAWNRAIKLAKGQFITNANTDDRLRKDALEILSSTLIDNPDVALVYADQFYSFIPNQTFEEVAQQRKPKLYAFPDYNYFHQLDRCLVCSQPMWRASLHFTDNIWFDEKYEICGDYDFDLKITQKYKMLHMPKSLGVFYSSLSNENKSYKYNELGVEEIKEMSVQYILNYIKTAESEELNRIINKFKRFLLLPIPIYYFWKRIGLFFNPHLIKDNFFHSIEFIYYFMIVIFEREHETEEAIRLCKKFLKYGKSQRIRKNLDSLLKQKLNVVKNHS